MLDVAISRPQRRIVASRKTLTVQNLTELGAERLAELLLQVVAGDAAAKRQLKLELASKSGGDEVATQIRKRLAAISKSRSFIDWKKLRGFAHDLDLQRHAIVIHVAPTRPAEAFDLIWRLLAMAPSIYERCDDNNGVVSAVMSEALTGLEAVAPAANLSQDILVDRVFTGVCANGYGQFDGLITMMAAPLGHDGLALLKSKFEGLAATPPKRAREEAREVIGYGSSGPFYADDHDASRHARLVQSALAEIADAMGDVDGYAACYSAQERANPAIAARIAERMLGTGRADEAMAVLENAGPMRRQRGSWPDWDRVRVELLESLGRSDEAQTMRWAIFEDQLDADYLRAFLKRLPDFDDDAAEERAIAHVSSILDFHQGLAFLIDWPAHDAASKMILARHRELDGDHYWHLSAAAEALENKHPLAATLVLRAMIDFALDRARFKRYPHAARHLQTCSHLEKRVEDFAPHADHDSYVAELKLKHGRKAGFWNA